MSKTASTTEDIREPQGVYLRRGGVNGPAELIILAEGRQMIVVVSDDRLLRLAADATHILATRPRQG